MAKRAISIDDIMKMRFNIMDFSGEYEASFGKPEMSGTWIIWGQSSNGKTRLSMQLSKYLTNFGKVAYNTLEEGARKSFQKAVEDNKMWECKKGKFIILDGEKYDDLVERLSKKRSPEIIIIDSIQYSGMDIKKYKQLKSLFPKKLFVYVSHAQGRLPKGRLADSVRYDADLKIRVEGFKAFPAGRLNGGGFPFTIWEDGAADYWTDIEQ